MTNEDEIGRMVWGIRDNSEDLFAIWMFQPARRAEFGKKEIDDIRETVVGLKAILLSYDTQRTLKVVSQ